MPFPVVYDACVLYPAPLRDLLMRLALTGLFRAHWTDRIHHEWMRSVLARRPDLKPEALERTRTLMNAAVPDCLVTGYEPLEQGLALKDPDDRHVLAAAIKCHAGVIVTFNLKDFPQDALKPYHIEAQHPDEFIHHLFDLQRTSVCAAVKAQREALKQPPRTVEEVLATLLQQGLPTTVAALRPMLAML
ncbi:PIN domain-containing protein [Dyella sp. 2RAB6]|uniref:PIN domain-containing protein n=1 Tax=Dyella sp. 2RAB6 TaxID=3232992 RepID=UPI003F926C56